MTLVLVPMTTLAAKGPTAPDLGEPPDTSVKQNLSNETAGDEPSADELGRAQELDLPEAPKRAPPVGPEYFHNYRNALTVRLGQIVSSQERNETRTPTLIGTQFSFMTRENRIYEAGANLLSDGSGTLDYSKRWIYTRDKLRPYTKLGGAVAIVPADRLVTFLKLENYRALAAAGFEYLLFRPASVRLEIGASLSTRDVQAEGSIGYVWAW